MVNIKPQPGIMKIDLYEGGASELKGQNDVLKLSSNENPFGPSPKAVDAYSISGKALHRYPSTSHDELRKAISRILDLQPENIICGVGSDEIISLLCQTFSGQGDEVIYTEHGFAMYKISALAAGATPVVVKEKNRTTDIKNILNKCNENTKLIFIANPNNPTGTYNNHEEVHSLLKKVPSSVLVVLDCAYFEYVTKDDYVRPLELLNEFDNLLITKTFSKIHGLASIRVGYGIANPSLIEVLNRIRQPFNVNSVAQAMACIAINDHDHIHQSIELNSQQYEFLYNKLLALGLDCIPSVGNFITFKGNFVGKEMFNHLMKKGVIVRSVDLYDMKDFIRVTIGTEAENLKFLSALEELL